MVRSSDASIVLEYKMHGVEDGEIIVAMRNEKGRKTEGCVVDGKEQR